MPNRPLLSCASYKKFLIDCKFQKNWKSESIFLETIMKTSVVIYRPILAPFLYSSTGSPEFHYFSGLYRLDKRKVFLWVLMSLECSAKWTFFTQSYTLGDLIDKCYWPNHWSDFWFSKVLWKMFLIAGVVAENIVIVTKMPRANLQQTLNVAAFFSLFLTCYLLYNNQLTRQCDSFNLYC